MLAKAALGAVPVAGVLFGIWLHTLADRLRSTLDLDGRSHAQQLEQILEVQQPFTLFIRSFRHDSSAPFAGYNQSMTFEKVLVAHLEPAGRFAAIGRPGEILPPVGATRLYVADRILLFVRLYSKGRLRSTYQELEAVDAVLQRTRGTGLPHHSEDSVLVWFDRDGRAFVESASTSVEIFDRVKAVLNRLPDDRRHLHSRLTKPGCRWRYGHFGSTLGSLCLFIAFAGVRV